MTNVIELNDANFDIEVKCSPIPVLVDFYAIWCGPCQKQLVILEELEKEFTGRAKIAKMNIDESKIKSVEFGVCSIPGIFIFKDGKVVEQMVGLHSQLQLSKMINNYLP